MAGGGMSDAETRAAALLVDADNVSTQCVEYALQELGRQGWRVSMRRAYGGHEKLAGMKDCLLRHAVRAFVNQGKGTTDALLVVDAMDLLHAGALPAMVAIASSDADFAPLALRLREAGRQVICFAQEDKSSDEQLTRCYDQLLYAEGAAPAKAAAPAPAAAKRAARQPTARKAVAPAPAPARPADGTRQVLESLAGFREGRWLEMNKVVEKLRDEKLLGKGASGPVFLRKNVPYVELAPADKPNKVRLRERG